MNLNRNKWKGFAVGEGIAKTASNTLSKTLGITGATFDTSIFTTFIIGVVQMIGGLALAFVHKESLFPGKKLILGSVLFGILAFIITVAGLYALTFPDADIGVFVFITLFGLLPGAFIDHIFFKTPLTLRQWLGVAVFLLGAYGMLNFPSLGEILELPTWIWITFIIPVGMAVNEGITRAISIKSASNPFVNNFWIGTTTAILGIVWMIAAGTLGIFTTVPTSFYVLSAAIGGVVIIMISFKLLSYKAGGTIVFKKIVMQGTHLISAIIISVIFFAEQLTFGKILGIGSFFISMFLMENK